MRKIFSLFILIVIFFNYGYAQHTIRIELATDRCGGETTWQIKERNTNTLIAQGGPYSEGSSNVAVPQNIPDINVDGTGCYEFIIYDSYADGICCTYGKGYFKIYYDGVLIGEGGEFGAESRVVGFGKGCPDNEISLRNIGINPYALTGQPVTIKGSITNLGRSLTSFDVRYKINDGEFTAYSTITCNVEMSDTVSFSHPIPHIFTETGLYTVTIEVANPNGVPDELGEDNNAGTLLLRVNANSTPKRVVLEHFSVEKCLNCPSTAANINDWLSSREDVIWVSHHVGYYTDQFTVPEVSNPLLVFYNTSSTYAPASMLDRKYLLNSEPGPIFYPNSSYTPGLIDQARSELSFVSVDFDGCYNANTRELGITVMGEFVGDVIENDLRVTIYLLEDNLRSTTQSGYSGTYIHNNVIRKALTPAEGDTTVISGNTKGTAFYKTYTTTIDAKWNVDNMKIVAFVHNWGTSINDRNILNAEQKSISDLTGINTDILSFTFGEDIDYSDAVINYDNKTIDIVVNEGINLSNLVAEFSLYPYSVAKIGEVVQESGVSVNNYEDKVVYTVVAVDKITSTDWTVNVMNRIAGIENISTANIRIYPNPAKSILNIDNAKDSKIVISNILGQGMIYLNNVDESQKINISNLEAGSYFVKIIKERDVYIHKILITK